ncbi:MAG TPA: response regulator [Methanomassiliicoccales archaeon]|jgi:PAS domain S-box-containing protein
MTSKEIHVLVVDDEQELCELTKAYLDLQGEMVVDTAFSAQGARDILTYKRYDIVLSDYMLPGENGIQFLTSLRTAGNRIPFILFTCKEREEIIIDALNSGANGYMQKGGSAVTQYKELENLIRTLVQQNRTEEALKDSEARYRDMVELIPAAIFEMDLSGNFTFLNHFALELFGYTSKEFGEGIEAMDVLVPEDSTRVFENLQRILQKNGTSSEEYTALKKDGTKLPISMTSSIILHHGHPVGLRGVVNAIRSTGPVVMS